MSHIDNINKNHENFKQQTETLEKLKIAAQNSVIQFNEIKKVIKELQEIAKIMGYKIDEETGELISMISIN